MLSYEGIFFDEENVKIIHSLESRQLPNINDEIHCTFKYHPNESEIFNDIVGKSFEVYLIGYGNDGKNSGFQVSFSDELTPYYINYDEEDSKKLKVPHITASLADGAEAFNTKNLKFKPLEKPIKVVGKFGYWIKNEDEEHLSFEQWPINKNTIK